ncbi:4-hydroxybenzoate 3-monooxygenase [Priestia filamentosa]|uniref:4-hydroxybenzoate 3-monooxygenase n=1 Tax=Priestia filamentosa TaxID=1402861 RepID=UPI003983A58B
MKFNIDNHILKESTTVVIVGAGIAGLTVANLLATEGIKTIVLERRSRTYVEQRQRAGVLEARAVRMFERWGLADKIISGIPYEGVVDVRIDGERRLLREELDGAAPSRMVPQQVLVNKLIHTLVEAGGDIRFEASDVELQELESERPKVHYRDTNDIVHEIECDFVAGCDGDLGVSRFSIPSSHLQKYSHNYEYAWLSIYAEVPTPRYPVMGIHSCGFAAQFARGREASRFYLQVTPNDSVDNWTDEQIWNELAIRLDEPTIKRGVITQKNIFPLRSVVYAPMRYGQLFLVGDSAHILPPASAKGANLALHDADILASAIREYIISGSKKALDAYSDTCLDHTWNYQEYAVWVSEMLHEAGDATISGPFRQKIARARFDRLFRSSTAIRLYSELMAGTN